MHIYQRKKTTKEPETTSSNNKPSTSSTTTTTNDATTKKATSTTAPPLPIDDFDNDFAAQLAAGMAGLLSEVENQEGGGAPVDPELKNVMQEMVKSMQELDANNAIASSTVTDKKFASKEKSTPTTGEESFQDKISETMAKLRDSSEKAEVIFFLKIFILFSSFFF